MAKPAQPENASPAKQADEKFGTIKQPQQTDATMRDQDTARGSEVSGRQHAGHRD